MVWEAIKLTGIVGTIFGSFAYAYSRVPLMLLIIGIVILAAGFINCIEKS